ncbi:MAG TPA: hypothetical protein VMW24_00725 [Sedimentisphaerales bacterium]|nr:hypothetical protein [Sedimentisphaerales bacterium]
MMSERSDNEPLAEKVVRLEERLRAAQEALNLSREIMDRRLEGMNEFREQLKEQATQFITRAEHSFVMKEINDLKESRAELRGKASQASVALTYVLTVIAILLGIVNMLR